MRFEKKGKSAYEGVVINQPFVYKKDEIIVEKIVLSPKEGQKEIERLRNSVKEVKQEIQELKKRLKGKILAEELEILVAHIMMLEDPMYMRDIEKMILKEKLNAEYVVKQVSDRYIELFNKIKDPLYAQRAIDIKDICERIIMSLSKNDIRKEKMDGKIIIAKEILPSQLLKAVDAEIDIKGLVFEYGGTTSHVAILAKSLGIPTLMGVENLFEESYDGDIILDSRFGEEKIIINPEIEELERYKKIISRIEKEEELLHKIELIPAITKDGIPISVKLNIGGSREVKGGIENKVDGIGLFRTELMYMESQRFPTEKEQILEYEKVIEKMGAEKEIVIRTLDIGADKMLPYYEMEKEDNPFLGVRGIRYSLKNKGIFKVQIRAILRAAYERNVKMMYPMITNCKEILEIKKIVEECKKELESEGVKYKKDIEQGVMIEVPSAVIMADQMAKYADFFSIGTNDLTQYVLATDRLSESLLELYDSYDPSILKMIDMSAQASRKNGKSICICGEMAAERLAVLAFLSMGIKEFSMVGNSVKTIKKLIEEVDTSKLEELRLEILNCENSEKVKNILNEYLKKSKIDI